MDAAVLGTTNGLRTYDVVIVGAGFAGLGMAIRLLQLNIRNFVILERGNDVGGTWRDNQYPGAACDVPVNLYSYSFAPNPNWSKSYAGSAEILQYIQAIVRDHKLQPFIRFGQNVSELTFDAQRGEWRAVTESGASFVGRSAVTAYGPLPNCSLPKITGIETYKGRKMHSGRWDHSYELRGKRVAVVGTGSSAVQVIPELVKQAAHLTVFQRTPGWVFPRVDLKTMRWNRAFFQRVPIAQKLARNALYLAHEAMALALVWNTPFTRIAEWVSLRHLRSQVRDRDMRRKLTPSFRMGCKRLLISNDYYPALQAPNCTLITELIEEMSPRGIRCVDGSEHEVDCVVFATGFDVAKVGTPFPVRGLDGRQLQHEWRQGARAYKSVSVSGYPNLFITFGPNSGPGHNSALLHLESQLKYIMQGIRRILEEDLLMLDVDLGAQQRHTENMRMRQAKTTWSSGCSSWYLTEGGDNPVMYPGFSFQYARQMGRFRDGDYHRTPRSSVTSRFDGALDKGQALSDIG